MLLCVHVCRCPWRLEEHIGSPGAGVRGNCKQVLYQELHSPTHSRQKICSFPLKFFQNTWQNNKHTSVTVSIDINQKLLRSWVEGISGNIAPVSVELPLGKYNWGFSLDCWLCEVCRVTSTWMETLDLVQHTQHFVRQSAYLIKISQAVGYLFLFLKVDWVNRDNLEEREGVRTRKFLSFSSTFFSSLILVSDTQNPIHLRKIRCIHYFKNYF